MKYDGWKELVAREAKGLQVVESSLVKRLVAWLKKRGFDEAAEAIEKDFR